jgi:5'(3')-deoxyribonucleotidase
MKKTYKLEIVQDTNPENPRNWDNLGKMICFHSRYNLGDKHNYKFNDYDSWEEMENAIIENENVHTILPLFLYDHSGITMNTTGFSCRWDSSRMGFIYISKEKVLKEGIEDKEVKKYLKNEVRTYNQYLTGEIYGYRLIEVVTCDLGLEHETEIDSCWGFYGSEIAEEEGNNMMKYYKEKELVG